MSPDGQLPAADRLTQLENGTRGWAPPDRLFGKPVAVSPLPVPATIFKYVAAVQELSGCHTGTAHAVVLGAINLLITDLIDVKSLAPDPLPTALMFITSVTSGGRKSTAFALAWKGHKQADGEAHRRWKSARGATSEEAPAVSFMPVGKPRPTAPRAIRSDTTIEAFVMNLSDGRPTQGLATAEAGKLLGGWSFTRGQRGHALSILNDLYSGEDTAYDRADKRASFYVEDKRLTVLLVGHQSEIAGLLLSPDAENGFSARTLLSFENRNFAAETAHEWADGETPRQYVDQLQELITKVRESQDQGVEYDDTEHPPRGVMHPSEPARQLLADYMASCLGRLDEDQGPHMESFSVRAPEQAARYAANLSGFRQLESGGVISELSYSGEDVLAAITTVEWHRESLAAFLEQAVIEADVVAAEAVVNQMRQWATTAAGSLIPLRTLIAGKASGKARYLRQSPDAKRRVLAILQEHQYICELKPGQFMVNPYVLGDGGLADLAVLASPTHKGL